ncbi:MAG: hypothetical protein JRH11_11850, partial [Deltaproteobacteria bacterium]|nr:hypothetical protein [Deltaproteobacteria bacterium]
MRAAPFAGLLGLALLSAVPVAAQTQVAAFDVPFRDRAPRVVEDVVRTVAVGESDPRITRLSARRLSARRRGEARARAAIHRWADQVLAEARASAMTAAAIHRVIDEGAVLVGRRPLVAG